MSSLFVWQDFGGLTVSANANDDETAEFLVEDKCCTLDYDDLIRLANHIQDLVHEMEDSK